MPDSPTPEREQARVHARQRYGLSRGASIPNLDRLTELAAALFDAPLAFVLLVGPDEASCVSAFGTNRPPTTREKACCRATLEADGPMVVEDLSVDDRFSDGPCTDEEGGIRFYAGMPLCTSDGHRIGTLCVLDREPRSPADRTVQQLEHLAEMAMEELERHQFPVDDRPELSQTILDHLPGIFYVFGPDARLWRWNSEFEERYGYSEESLRGRSGTSFFDGDDRERVAAKIAEVFESGSGSVEADFITNNGDRVPMLFTGVRVQLAGEPHLVGMGVNIADRREAERELRRQRNVLRMVFEHIPVMITIVDEGSCQLVNRQVEKTLGWSKAEAVGRADLLSTLLKSGSMVEDGRQFLREAPDEWREYAVQTKEEGTLPIRARVVKLDDGRRLGIGIDLSEEKRRQERLRLLEAALEHSRVPIVIMKAAPGSPVEYTNPVFTEVTGYDQDEIRGRSFELLQGPDTDADTVERLHEALAHGDDVREVVRCYKKDGTPFWNDIYMAPVPNQDGEVTHYVSIQADVTERVQRRQALRQAKEEAEEANRIKSALLSNMNHEFRTPLTSIISFSELIVKSPGLADDFADRILEGGTRLLRTLNTVMDFAQLEGDQIRPTPEVFDVCEVVRTVLSEFRPDAERSGLEVVVDVPDRRVMVVLDRHHVERMCTHLVSNAIKFTEAGTVTVRIRDRENATELVVEDTGIGIDPAFRSDMYDEFAQASSGYDRTYEGNGLGLTIVKRLVEQSNGSIAVESEPGVGTQVTVQLPEDVRT